jgi:hypothetical protein
MVFPMHHRAAWKVSSVLDIFAVRKHPRFLPPSKTMIVIFSNSRMETHDYLWNEEAPRHKTTTSH